MRLSEILKDELENGKVKQVKKTNKQISSNSECLESIEKRIEYKIRRNEAMKIKSKELAAKSSW